MKYRTVMSLSAIVICGLVCGCVSHDSERPRYGDPSEIVAGSPEKPTLYDIESSAHALMQKMMSSHQFSKNYNDVKAAKNGALPIVIIGNVANRTSEHIQGRLDAVGDTVRSLLLESGFFEVKDDEAGGAIASRILRGADDGLEDGALVQLMGTHESPDFIVLGDFRHFEDVGGIHTYRLHLAFHNLKTGKVVWEGIKTKVKL